MSNPISKDDVFKKAQEKMDSVLAGVKRDFGRIRTGKASTELVEGLRVSCYGSEMPLNQISALSVPDSKTIAINPWDKSTIPAIEKAIQQSELGISPVNDGNIVRINIPPLSEERRKELVKVARHAAEEGRVHIRNVRRDANEHLKQLGKDGGLTEDELERAEKDIQKRTDDHILKIDELLRHKEEETLKF